MFFKIGSVYQKFQGYRKNFDSCDCLYPPRLPLAPITPEGVWDESRIHSHTLETSDTILKKDG